MPKLLVIDDEPAVGYSFTRALAKDAIDVLTEQTGAGGLESFRANAPDVVVLDIRLPDRGGLDVFRDLRRIDPRRSFRISKRCSARARTISGWSTSRARRSSASQARWRSFAAKRRRPKHRRITIC